MAWCGDYSDNPFKDPKGKWYTVALFYETAQYTQEHVMYSLSPDDKQRNGKVFPSLKRYYLELMDVTEYTFATKYLGGWDHWQRLITNNATIRRYVEGWREELKLKLKSQALLSMNSIAADDQHKGQLQAVKYIADKGYQPTKTAGRPSKKAAEEQKAFDALVDEHVAEDLERIRSLQ